MPYLHVLAQDRKDCGDKGLEGDSSRVGSRCNGAQGGLLGIAVAGLHHLQQFGHQGLQVPLQLLRACIHSFHKVSESYSSDQLRCISIDGPCLTLSSLFTAPPTALVKKL